MISLKSQGTFPKILGCVSRKRQTLLGELQIREAKKKKVLRFTGIDAEKNAQRGKGELRSSMVENREQVSIQREEGN